MLPFRPSQRKWDTEIIPERDSLPFRFSPTTDPGRSNVITSLEPSPSVVRQETQIAPPSPMRLSRRLPRPWDKRIDPEKEVITNFRILMASNGRASHMPFLTVPRVLLSLRLPRSYIYENLLLSLGYSYVESITWKCITHLGFFEPIGVAGLFVKRADDGLDDPFFVKFDVLSGSPPEGGVDFILGSSYFHAAIGQELTWPLPARSSKAMPFSSGKLLPCLTGTGGSNDASRNDSDLPSHDAHDPGIPLCKREPELSPLDAEQDEPEILPLFPWKSEFSWRSQQLMLDGEELPTTQRARTLTEDNGAIDGGSSTASSTGNTAHDSVLSLGTIISETLSLAASKDGQTARIIAERRELLANLLEEHYWRTHPPQRSGNQNGPRGRHSGIATNSEPSNATTTSHSSRGQRPPKRRRGIGNSSGGGDDEEEEEEEGGGGTPPRARGSVPTKYFACPFLKWRARQYYSNTCGRRFSSVSHIIDHLRHMHYAKHCAQCHLAFDSPEQKKDHLCTETHGLSTRPDIISEEQWERISERPKGKRKHESSDPETRWHHIFRILFPQSPTPHSAYIIAKENELMDGLLAYAESLGHLQDDFSHKLAQLISGYMTEGTSGSAASQDITLVNRVHAGGVTPSPDHCVGSSNALIGAHHASQPAMLTTEAPPMQSPCQRGKLSALPNPTTTELNTSSSSNEIMNNTAGSGRDEEGSLDLFLHENVGLDKWMEVPDTGRDHLSMGLCGLRAWDDSLGSADRSSRSQISSNNNRNNGELSPMDIDNDLDRFFVPCLAFPPHNPSRNENDQSLSLLGGALRLADVTLTSEFPGDLTGFATLSTGNDGTRNLSDGPLQSTSNVSTGLVSNDVSGGLDLSFPQWMDDHDGFHGPWS